MTPDNLKISLLEQIASSNKLPPTGLSNEKEELLISSEKVVFPEEYTPTNEEASEALFSNLFWAICSSGEGQLSDLIPSLTMEEAGLLADIVGSLRLNKKPFDETIRQSLFQKLCPRPEVNPDTINKLIEENAGNTPLGLEERTNTYEGGDNK